MLKYCNLNKLIIKKILKKLNYVQLYVFELVMESGCSDFWLQATFTHNKSLRGKWNNNVILSFFCFFNQDPESSILIRW